MKKTKEKSGKIKININNWWASLLPLPGILVLTIGIFQYQEEQAVRTWPLVTGWILSVKINLPVEDDDDWYDLEWKYIYEVDDKEYINNDFSASGEGTNFFYEYEAKAQAKKYSEGTEVSVYYNPEKPTHAYIIPYTKHSSGRDLSIVGIALLVLLVIMAIIILKNEG